MCDVKNCDGDYAVIVEGGYLLCEKHGRPTKLVCKHCKVPVVSRTNTQAIFGREHGKHCPRRFK